MILWCTLSWGLIFGGVSYVRAQESQPQPERAQAQLQALSARIMSEVNSNLACSTEVVVLQQEIKRLAEKYEPKADKK